MLYSPRRRWRRLYMPAWMTLNLFSPPPLAAVICAGLDDIEPILPAAVGGGEI